MKKIMFLGIITLLCLANAAHAQASPGFTRIANQQSATSFVDGTCPNQNTCYYQVTAVDTATGHESAPATCAAAQLCFATNQSVATMPSSGTHSVSVSWTASASLPAGMTVTYNVYRAFGPPSATNVSSTVN